METDSAEFFSSDTFNMSGEQEFRNYYYELGQAPLKGLEIKTINYDSTITVRTNETVELNGSEVVYEADYELAPTYDNTDLKVEGFSFSKLNETSLEATISEDTIRSFLTEYRTNYMDALNRDDSSSILSYLESGQSAYTLITDYFAAIEGKGNIYTPEKFLITNVEHTGANLYEVTTDESFILEESTGKKTENTRQRTYTIHVVQPDRLFIQDFKVLSTSSNEIMEPTADNTGSNANGGKGKEKGAYGTSEGTVPPVQTPTENGNGTGY